MSKAAAIILFYWKKQPTFFIAVEAAAVAAEHTHSPGSEKLLKMSQIFALQFSTHHLNPTLDKVIKCPTPRAYFLFLGDNCVSVCFSPPPF